MEKLIFPINTIINLIMALLRAGLISDMMVFYYNIPFVYRMGIIIF